ncbi:hypothetical protein N0V82_009636 [Gnomoniopsis sp. IMI 355080]|nr:hypothetical protein N0V82_009636 [Gnomoniopsis sp. IMI 355080]
MELITSILLRTLALLLPLTAVSQATSSPRRGLCFVPNVTTPQDDRIWIQQPSDLTWYYNYLQTPSVIFEDRTQEDFEFVPMLWGPPDKRDNASTFEDAVKTLVQQGRNIGHVMTFNEPEMLEQWGGANMDPRFGAEVWIRNIPPLQSMGIKVGLPATAGTQESFTWLERFLRNCSEMVSGDGEKRNCTYDFVPFHHYGDFVSLASAFGQYTARFPDTPLWLTEFNYHNQSLEVTKDFYQWTTKWLDGLAFLKRYALFGAFRSDVSNVGPNAAMLNDQGQLTDIGVWYLGRNGHGEDPITKQRPDGNHQPSDATGRGLGEGPLGQGIATLGSVLAITFVLLIFF